MVQLAFVKFYVLGIQISLDFRIEILKFERKGMQALGGSLANIDTRIDGPQIGSDFLCIGRRHLFNFAYSYTK